jgi:tetratricopeptide (TPR) repeat protein
VAAGLAHAHERGIVHRDLKPANILISDDGEPLVLDFNLATDSSPATAHLARLGGTLPYMSPEQLQSFAEISAAKKTSSAVGPASDVYALGVVLYESLTRELPFGIHAGSLDEVVRAMLADRQRLPVPVEKRSPSISPGLAAIVEKCLAVDPSGRYHNAGELCEDLRRHLENLPLVHVRERSLKERGQKWCRRHPKLSSATSITAVAAILALVAGSFWMAREARFAERQAENQFETFHAAVPQARTLLIVSSLQTAEEKQGIQEAERLLQTYGARNGSAWTGQAAVQRLSGVSRHQLADDVADLQSLVAARRLRTTDSEAPSSDEKRTQPSTALLVAAVADVRRGKTGAIGTLDELVTRQPGDAANWLVLADCRRLAGDHAGADAACTAAIALRSDLYLPWYYRGLVRLSQKRTIEAAADFDQAIARHADFPGGWANRGLAREQLGKHKEAIDDLTRAIDRGVEEPPLYFCRARCYEAIGEKDAAEHDWLAGLAQPPHDAQGWFERGMVHVRRQEWQPAESDFRQASEMQAGYIDALRNLAHVQSERLGQIEAGIDTQTRILAQKPGDSEARVARGVLYARLDRAREALADATAVMRMQPKPLAV